jgi:hypothetical protein
LSYESGPWAPCPELVEVLFRACGRCEDSVQSDRQILGPMADFLAVLGIIGFVVVMLGLIWALDRV